MERSPEFRQLLIGISTSRYLPPSGTAGFDRSFVNGNKRVPAPPPMMMARVRCVVPGGRAGAGIVATGFAPKESRVERFFVSTNPLTQIPSPPINLFAQIFAVAAVSDRRLVASIMP